MTFRICLHCGSIRKQPDDNHGPKLKTASVLSKTSSQEALAEMSRVEQAWNLPSRSKRVH
jgi:hypothetical protein